MNHTASPERTATPSSTKMQRRALGKSGLITSAVGLGCWQLGGDFGPVSNDEAFKILAAADDAGINFWDTADVYGAGLSEERIGTWEYYNPNKRTVVSKVGRNAELYPHGYQYDRMRRSIEDTLTRLKKTQLDLIQLHCIPLKLLERDQVWRWLEDFCDEGLIKHYGASVETLEQARSCINRPGLTSLQIIFNVLRQDAADTLLQEAQEANVGIIARLPLASGLLSGRYNANTTFSQTDHRYFNRNGQAFSVGETFSGIPFNTGLNITNQLSRLCPQNMTLAQMAIRWVLDFPQVSSVIVGAKTVEQVYSNAAAAQLPSLSTELHAQLRAFYYKNVRKHIRGQI